MKYSSLSMAAVFGNVMSSASPHGGGGSGIHSKWMDIGAISSGNHQGPVVMKEAHFGGVDGNSSAGGNDGGGDLDVVTTRTQDHLGGGYGHRGSAMVDVAVEGGGISGDAYGVEGRWGEGLGLATEVGSGVIAKSNTLEVDLVGGTNWWKRDSEGGVKDVSSLAGREDAVDIHESSGGNSGVFAVVSWHDSVQSLAVSRRDGVVSLEKNSELVEDDTISSDEVESGDGGLERSESPQLNWIQKILGSARMGGISGPLLIQSSILYDVATSTNKGGLVVDGVESEVSNSSLASPSSRAVIVQDGDSGVSIHSIVNEDESAYVSKPEVSKDVLPEPKNLSLKLKADDDGEVDPSVQDTTVDVLSDTSTKTLEETKDMSRKSDCLNFLIVFAVLIFVMIMTAVSCFSFSSRLRSMFVVDLNLSFLYAGALYDCVCKTLRIVLLKSSLLYSNSNHTGGKRRKGRGKSKSHGKGRGHGKSRSKAKQKAAPPQLKGYRSLLVLMVVTGVLCILGSGEAVWFSHNNDSEAAEEVNDLLDDGVVEGVSIETDSVSGSSNSGHYTNVDAAPTSSNKVQHQQALFDPPINSNAGVDGVVLQEYGSTSDLVSFQKELSVVRSELVQIASDDSANPQDVLKATSTTMSLVKDHMVDLELSKAMPGHLQPIVRNVLTQITNAERHIQKVDELLSRYGVKIKTSSTHRKLLTSTSSNSGRRILSNTEHSSSDYHFRPRHTTKADYHHRAKNRHIEQGLGNHFTHQQGYYNARVLREEGKTTHRRLQAASKVSVCIPIGQDERRLEQCYRLADCAQNYSLYDLLVYLFGDDIDFTSGVVDELIIKFEDEKDLEGKLTTIKALSEDIIQAYNDDNKDNVFFPGGVNNPLWPQTNRTCDKLLQEFHRFDEDLSIIGKWQGGSVTGVCRGYGTSKFASLESIFNMQLTRQCFNTPAKFEDPGDEDDFGGWYDVSGCGACNDYCRWVGNSSTESLDPKVTRVYESSWWSCALAGAQSEYTPKGYFSKWNYKKCEKQGEPTIEGERAVNITIDIFEEFVGCTDTVIQELRKPIFSQANAGGTNPYTPDRSKIYHEQCGICEAEKCQNGECDPEKYQCQKNYGYNPVKSTCGMKSGDKVFSIGESEANGGTCGAGGVYALDRDRKKEASDCTPSTYKIMYGATIKDSCGLAVKENADGSINSATTIYLAELRYTCFLGPCPKPKGAFFSSTDRDNWCEDTKKEYQNAGAKNVLCKTSELPFRFKSYTDPDCLKDDDGDGFSNRYNADFPSGGVAQLPVAQFQVPISVNTSSGTAVDRYGQLKSIFLDEVFEYKRIGNPGLFKSDGSFSDTLQKEFRSRIEDTNGTTSLSLLAEFDASVALLFGNKTTIGQVCAYAKGLESQTVNDVPGFCCLDAPYQSDDWGEKYTCQKYVPDGSSAKVVQKGPGDCNKLGPVTTGFNQAACDTFQGTWCSKKRSCKTLVNCIKAELEIVKPKGTDPRPAFFEYLDGAPKIEVADVDDPSKCGGLRKYFEYDEDFADDLRICEEVKDLKCFTDFTNLDGFATGTPAAEIVNPDVQLAVSDEVTTIPAGVEEFDGDRAKEWADTNYSLRKILDNFLYVDEQLNVVSDSCELIPCLPSAVGCIDGAKAGCNAARFTLKVPLPALVFIAQLALDISEKVYEVVVDGQDGNYAGERSNAIYENSILNARNIITTFYATQQLKTMLGDVQTGLEGDREERGGNGRRLQSVNCVDTSDGFLPPPCREDSCQDKTRLCDGSYNYTYISKLVTAGCDDLDSDGDREADECEDRYPPNILIRDAKIFRCDKFDTSKLCYTDKWFKHELDVLNFLEYEFAAVDDCAPSTKLSVTFDKNTTANSTCENTKYTITPFQDYPKCNNRTNIGPFNLTFTNPLAGTSKEVTVQLDEVAPVVECGFLAPNTNSANEVDVDGKTLYHYMLKTEGGGRRLNDARLKDAGFFYNVEENCDADVNIDVVVESNELQQNTVSQLFKRKRVDFVEQAEFLYAPTHCDCEKKVDGLCKTDASMGDLKTRYYDITVTASDSAGHIGSDTCKVVIVPSCNPETDSDCAAYDRPDLPNVEDFYYTRSAVDASVTQSQVLNQVSQQKLVWESGLATLDPDVMVEEAVDVDVDPPVVECDFIPNVNSINMVKGDTLYHFMSKADGDGNRLEDARFFYNLTENCEDDVHVNVVVKSNEIQQNKINIAELFKRKREGIVEQLDVLYAPTRCGCENKGLDGLCRPDPTMGDLKTRFYDITVTASDFAGNSASVTCKVVIVPNCDPDSDPVRCDNQIDDTFYYSIEAVNDSVGLSTVHYEIDEEKLIWERGLEMPALDDELGSVDIDVDPPVVECDFIPNVNSINKVEDNTLYHFMSKADGDGNRLEDARFFYNLTENCEDDVHVNVVVKSNEIQQNKINIAELFKRKREGIVEQLDVLYAPTRCGCENKGLDGLCRPDPTMGDLKTRFYDIEVTASDFAGNSASVTCKVVIVPNCDPVSDPVRCDNQIDSTFYYSIEAVKDSVGLSTVHYEIDEEKLIWERGLEMPTLDDELSESVDVDVDPPILTCSIGTQGLTGNGAGVFTDLGFTFTAVDGGKKCTDTKDLAVTVEVLSNEVVATGDDMVVISDSRVDGSPSIWAEDNTCNSSNNGKCKVSSPKKLREYVVRVTATDESRNSDTVQCNTIVGGKQGDIAVGDPLFLISKVDFIGGVEVDDVQADSEVLVEAVSGVSGLAWEAEPTGCKESGESAPGGCSGGSNPGCCSGACSKKSMLCKA